MKKSTWIICLASLGLDLLPQFSSLCFAGHSCAYHILFGQNIIQTVVMEKSSGDDTFDDDSWSPWRPAFYVGVAFAIGLNVLYFVRKIVVVAYGYKKIRIPAFGYDRRSLSEIARSQASERRRWLFNLLNTLIYVLVISMVISFFLLAVVELLRAGFGRLVFQMIKEQMYKIWN